MAQISDILEKIKSYAPDADLQLVMTAYLLAARAHAGQTRKSGEAYLTHPLAVAMILADLRMDVDTIATALLHDALEDNPITKAEMEKEIGPVVTELVDGVTKIGKLKFRSKEELAAENFRKMMLAMSRDIRVILVKMADRLHNMSTLEHHRADKQKQIARETLDIFVPIANRLGITKLKIALENLCIKFLHPEVYAEIEAYLERTQSDREAYIARITTVLEGHLEECGLNAGVYGRAKHNASIWRKVDRQQCALHEIHDLLAFRIICEDVGACYAALGWIHSKFPPIPDRIKDYIARPKPNGYQSLHTTVIGPEQRRIEVQIRTADMHRVAEDGIAAHWKYKEGHLAVSPEDVARISRIREVFEVARETDNATEFMETVKFELYADEVFVFTPNGDIKRFPLGATTLDFAYAVHTDVGHRCTGAKVNGRMVPLRYKLQSGDAVEILTSPNQKPNRDWVDIARTGRAVSKIRKYLRDQEHEQGVRLGRELLDSALKRFQWSLDKARREGQIKPVLKQRKYKEFDELLVDIARGQQPASEIAKEMVGEAQQVDPSQAGGLTSLLDRLRPQRSTQSPVLITGEADMLVNFAGCCDPLPGEDVVGFITRGRGITVHRVDCDQLGNMDSSRRVPVEWDRSGAATHSGSIEVYVGKDEPGLLAKITKVCEKAKVNISQIQAQTLPDNRAKCDLRLSVRDVDELTQLIRNIERIQGVEAVRRVAG